MNFVISSPIEIDIIKHYWIPNTTTLKLSYPKYYCIHKEYTYFCIAKYSYFLATEF